MMMMMKLVMVMRWWIARYWWWRIAAATTAAVSPDVVVAVDAAKELHDDRAHRADWSRTFSPLLRPRRRRRMGFHQRHFPCWSSLSYCYLVTCEARRILEIDYVRRDDSSLLVVMVVESHRRHSY